MCGIICCVVQDSTAVRENVLKIFKNQEGRGKEGFGMAIKRGESIYRHRAKTLKKIRRSKLWNVRVGDILMFHHRLPTSTPNLPRCNHPIMNENQSIALIHNGHIHNYNHYDFRTHRFETAIYYVKEKKTDITDSEKLVHVFEDYLLKDDIETALTYLVEGNWYSSICLLVRGEGRLFFGSSSQDLAYFEDGSGNRYIASEPCDGFENIMDISSTTGYCDSNGFNLFSGWASEFYDGVYDDEFYYYEDSCTMDCEECSYYSCRFHPEFHTFSRMNDFYPY